MYKRQVTKLSDIDQILNGQAHKPSKYLYNPVSYTHLDVYKRQAQYIAIIGGKGARHKIGALHELRTQNIGSTARLRGSIAECTRFAEVAVSYTHLDVYKRQHLVRNDSVR